MSVLSLDKNTLPMPPVGNSQKKIFKSKEKFFLSNLKFFKGFLTYSPTQKSAPTYDVNGLLIFPYQFSCFVFRHQYIKASFKVPTAG